MININHHHTVFTAEQMHAIDQATIADAGISGDLLMEIAGFQAAREIMRRQNGKKRGLILCGSGNNAGDVLVAARYLLRNGYRLSLCYIGGTKKFSPEAERNYIRLQKSSSASHGSADAKPGGAGTRTPGSSHPGIPTTGNPQITLPAVAVIDDPSQADARDFDFAIDGLFGTGLNKEVRDAYKDAILRLNDMDLFTYAMDIPSGLDADTGEIHGVAVLADITCTFGGLKHGFYTPDGFNYTGEVVFCELPFPVRLYPEAATAITAIHPDLTEIAEPVASRGRHKYERGIVYILGGSPGLTGAPILSAQAAWKAGPGAVVVICPAGLMSAFEQNLVEPVKKAAGSTDDVYFKSSHIRPVLDTIREKPGIVLLGPGMGRNSETVGFTKEIILQAGVPMVIDADGLWCMSKAGIDGKFRQQTVLTPHPGELQQLTGRQAGTNNQRLEQAKKLSLQTGAIMVSKGNPTYVTGNKTGTFLTAYDSTHFGRTGFGDVLAGKIASALATGYDPVSASVHALLDGYRKYRKAASSDFIPGPADIL